MAAICNVPVALRVSAVKRTRATRGMSVKAAAGPNHWLPGTEPPAYLDGTMAGDYGASRDPRARVTIGDRRDAVFARTRAARAIATFPGRRQSSAPRYTVSRVSNEFLSRSRETDRSPPPLSILPQASTPSASAPTPRPSPTSRRLSS